MILTDYKVVLAFKENKDTDDQHIRWRILMSIFDFDIQHLDGKRNVLVDTLLRSYKNPKKLPQITSISSATTTTTTTNNNNNASSLYLNQHFTSTLPPTFTSPTKSSADMQFTTTTVDRSHTKCDYNPCAS